MIEPISANQVECMSTGAKTSFKEVVGLTAAHALSRDMSLLPAEWEGATFCEEYEFRVGCCVRTWLRPHAQDNLLYGPFPSSVPCARLFPRCCPLSWPAVWE